MAPQQNRFGDGSTIPAMRCEERERLWENYNQALRILNQSVEDLDRADNSVVWAARLMSAKAANNLSKAARDIWEDHLRTHQCDAEAPRE